MGWEKGKRKKKKEEFAFIYTIRLLHVFPPCKIRFLFLYFPFLISFHQGLFFHFLISFHQGENCFSFSSFPFLSLHFLHFTEQSVIVITQCDQLHQIFNKKNLYTSQKFCCSSLIQISLLIVNVKLSRNFNTISYMFYIRFLI